MAPYKPSMGTQDFGAEGSQLPYVDVVHQAAAEYVSPGPFDLPEVRAWTRRQGLNVGRRDVLSEIGA